MLKTLLSVFLFCSLAVNWLPASAGGPADNSQVLVVLIFDQGCKTWCQKVRPMMKELKEQYGDKVEFAELDASLLKESEAKARELGVFAFLRDSAEWVPIVGVFSRQRKLFKELVGPKDKQVYASVIDKALATQ